MIGYICLLYVGTRIGAPWWYYCLIGLAVCVKVFAALEEMED